MKIKSFLFFLMIAALVISPLQADDSPLKLTPTVGAVVSGTTPTTSVSLDIKNLSAKRVRAFVVVIHFGDANGKPTGHYVYSAVKGVKGGPAHYMKTGDVDSMSPVPIPKLPSGVVDKVTQVWADVVIFEDGTKWGACKTKKCGDIQDQLKGK